MDRFHILDDCAVILRSKGVYKQAKVYARDGRLYAAHGGGFVSLMANLRTSHPDVSWDETDAPHTSDNLGRLLTAGGAS